MIALWHRLTAPWRRRRDDKAAAQQADEDADAAEIAAYRPDDTMVLHPIEAWRDGETPAEPEDEPDVPGAYRGKHRKIGAGWGVPPTLAPLIITVPPTPAWHRVDTGELDLARILWGRDLGEEPPVRGLAPTFAEVR